MTPLNSKSLLLILGVLATCCQTTDPSRREFDALERALGALSTAPPEDRAIRLGELMKIEITDTQIKELRELCAESYRSFSRAEAELGRARDETAKIEQAVDEARREKLLGKGLSLDQENSLREKSKAAQSSLDAVNSSLDRADQLIKNCDNRRRDLRAHFADR